MLKIMTLNCNQLSDKHGTWLRRKKMIEALIREADPDVITLQAVCQNPKGKDQARQIAEAAGYGYYFFVPAQQDAEGRCFGQAMITKHAFAGTYSTELSLRSALEDSTRRLILVAELPTRQGMLRIFNTHFSWVEEQLRDNVEETVNFLEEFSGMGILTGDLNADADSGFLEPFRKAGWCDAWELLRRKESGFTFESDNPLKRIDYVLVNEAAKRYVGSIDVLGKESANHRVRLSDHLALIAGLEVTVGALRPRRAMAESRF